MKYKAAVAITLWELIYFIDSWLFILSGALTYFGVILVISKQLQFHVHIYIW